MSKKWSGHGLTGPSTGSYAYLIEIVDSGAGYS